MSLVNVNDPSLERREESTGSRKLALSSSK